MQLGPVDGRLLDDDRVPRQPLGQRGEDMAGEQRLAGGGRSRPGGGRNCSGAASIALRSRLGELRGRPRRAGRARRARRGCGAPRRRVVRSHAMRVSGLGEPAGRVRATGGRRAPRRRGSRRTGASFSRRRGRSAGRKPAKSRWSCGNPARAPNDSWKTGATSRSASSTSAAHARRVVGARARRRAPASLAPRGTARAGRPRPDRPRLPRTTRPRGRVLALVVDAADQSSIGTITSAGPRARRCLVRRRGRSRRERPAPAPAGRPTPGSRRRGRSSRPVRNGSKTRWRRSCWPTMITSGARFTRAVAIAPTAFPSPAVVCRSASDGLAAADRVARSRARRPAPSCSPSTNSMSSGQAGEERDLGRAGVREHRRQAAATEDVERRVADAASHAALGQPQTSSATSTISRELCPLLVVA